MKLRVNDNLTLKEPRKISVKTNGVWTEPKETWINDTGIWKPISKTDGVLEINAQGYDDTYGESYAKLDGVTLRNGSRGWNFVIFRRENKLLEPEVYRYDTHADTSLYTTAANLINNSNSGDLFLIFTHDQPALTGGGLDTTFYNSLRSSFNVTTGLANLVYRGSYALIAFKYGKKMHESLKGRYYTGDDAFSLTGLRNVRQLWGDYETHDFTSYTKTRISTTQTLQASFGYSNLPQTYTVSSLDWSIHTEAASYFDKDSGYDLGQITLGNRLVFEMGNEKSDMPNPAWDSIGNIVKVEGSSQNFYMKKIASPEPFSTSNNADDNGIWEVVKMINTNFARLTSTTEYYLMTP